MRVTIFRRNLHSLDKIYIIFLSPPLLSSSHSLLFSRTFYMPILGQQHAVEAKESTTTPEKRVAEAEVEVAAVRLASILQGLRDRG